MSKARPFLIALAAILTVALVLQGGAAARWVTGLVGPRVSLDVTGRSAQAQGAPGHSTGTRVPAAHVR